MTACCRNSCQTTLGVPFSFWCLKPHKGPHTPQGTGILFCLKMQNPLQWSRGCHLQCKRCSTRVQRQPSTLHLLGAADSQPALTCCTTANSSAKRERVCPKINIKQKTRVFFMQVKALLSRRSCAAPKTRISYRYGFSHFFLGTALSNITHFYIDL